MWTVPFAPTATDGSSPSSANPPVRVETGLHVPAWRTTANWVPARSHAIAITSSRAPASTWPPLLDPTVLRSTGVDHAPPP